MDKNFDKYRTIGPDYHYRQIDKSSFRNYNAWVDARFKKIINAIQSKARGRNLKLLDVGCGDGVVVYLISKNLPQLELYGIDPVEEALEVARQKIPQAKFLHADSQSLPFENQTFDIVISSDVIEHIEDVEKMLNEISRVARSGSLIIIGTPIRYSKYPIDPHHVQEFFPEDFVKLLSKYFRDIKLHESHNLATTLLYNAPTKSFLNWKYAINLLAYLGYNPFLKERMNESQAFSYMYAVCKK